MQKWTNFRKNYPFNYAISYKFTNLVFLSFNLIQDEDKHICQLFRIIDRSLMGWYGCPVAATGTPARNL